MTRPSEHDQGYDRAASGLQGTDYIRSCMDWWEGRFLYLKRKHRLTTTPTLFQKWWYPHRLQELDDELTAEVWAIGVNDTLGIVGSEGFWPWRTDGPETLFKTLGLETSDFRIPPWWEHLYEEKER